MYQIKNVVNYDRDALDLALDEEMKRSYADKRVRRLSRRSAWISRGYTIISFAGLACTLFGIGLTFSDRFAVLGRILNLLGLCISTFCLTVLSSAVPKALLKNTEQLKETLDSYGNTLPMKFHMFFLSHEDEELEIWGAEINDSEFEVALSALQEDGSVAKETLVCRFDSQNPCGVLTLDVRNGTVFRMAPLPDEALPVSPV